MVCSREFFLNGAGALAPCTPDLFERYRVLATPNTLLCGGERDAETANALFKALGREPLADALQELESRSSLFKVLGAYPKAVG